MFILVAGLNESGFFRWIGLLALRAAEFNIVKIFLIFNCLAAFLAAFMDSITVMIFMATLSIEVCVILRVPALPIIISEICSANIGGSATMVGDPPNVIIGTALGLSFSDFAAHTGPITIVVFGLNLSFFYLVYRKKILIKNTQENEEIVREHRELDPHSAIINIRQMRLSLMAFAFTVTLLVMHDTIDMLVSYIAILGAALVLLIRGRKMGDMIDKIDWHTIVFLAGLFVMVGGLEHTGMLAGIGHAIIGAVGDNPLLIATSILWFAAILSAILDNVPLSAAFVPIIRSISEQTGMDVNSLGYTLALGCDVGGSATPIGASANVVGLAVAEKNGIHCTWKYYCRLCIPAMLICMIIINALVLILFW